MTDKPEDISESHIMRDMLFEDTSKILGDLNTEYIKSMSSGISLVNMSLIGYLYYKTCFNESKEQTFEFLEDIVNSIHGSIAKVLVESVNVHDQYPFLKDDIDALITDVEKVVEDSLKDIKKNVRDVLEVAIKQFSNERDIKADTPNA